MDNERKQQAIKLSPQFQLPKNESEKDFWMFGFEHGGQVVVSLLLTCILIMCRWIVYAGVPILLADILILPRHSLCSQTHEHYLPDLTSSWNISTMVSMVRRNAAVNADGFGMGWYNDGVSDEPVIFTSIAPAENNLNLKRLAFNTKSRIVFGHARAASPGSAIHEMNCHPFQFGRYCFMHNGGIANFRVLKRPLQNLLSQSSFNMIGGTTDSELAGALFVDQLPDRDPTVEHPPEVLTATLRRTLLLIHDMAQMYGNPIHPASMVSSLNFAVTDGHTTVCSRFRDSTVEDPPSLYYCRYTKQVKVEGEVEFYFDEGEPVIGAIVGSEPLTFNKQIWKLVPKNSLVTITSDHALKIDRVFDENYLARKALLRWKSFVQQKRELKKTLDSAAHPSSAVPPTPDMSKIVFSANPDSTSAETAGDVSLRSFLATASTQQLKVLQTQLNSVQSASSSRSSNNADARGQLID